MKKKDLFKNLIALIVVALSFNIATAQNLNSAIAQSSLKQKVNRSNVETNTTQPIHQADNKSEKHYNTPEVILSESTNENNSSPAAEPSSAKATIQSRPRQNPKK